MTRLFIVLLCLGLSACTSSETASPTAASESDDGETSSSGFDAQAWLVDARATALAINDADLDDPRVDRMKHLANDLDEVASWRRACDTYRDYETGEMAYDPIPPGEGHWVRGTLEVGDVSATEAVVAIICDYGAYQGSYAFVHIDENRVAVLSTPELDDGGLPLGDDILQTTFATPDFARIQEGRVATFARARGLGDCGNYAVYGLTEGDMLPLLELRSRDCSSDIPDDLPLPSEWPIVYMAQN